MGMRKWAMAGLVVLLALAATTPTTAWVGSEWEINLGNIQVMDEWVVQRPSMTLFHTQTLATSDTEALAIAFPFQASIDTACAPFGFPAIAQTSDATVSGTSTGFFKANWCYINAGNPGGYELGHDISLWHPVRSAYPVGSGLMWPYMLSMQPAMAAAPAMSFKPYISESPGTPGTPGTMTPAKVSMLGTNDTKNATKNATGTNASKMKNNRDYKNMTKADIKNMSGLEKMYRNANMKNTVPESHIGDTARPSMIAPKKNPMDLIKPADKQKVLKDSLNMTQADTHLLTRAWDL